MVAAPGTSALAGSALGAPGALGTPPDGDAMEGAECATGGGGGRVGAFAAGASKTLVPGSSGGTLGRTCCTALFWRCSLWPCLL